MHPYVHNDEPSQAKVAPRVLAMVSHEITYHART